MKNQSQAVRVFALAESASLAQAIVAPAGLELAAHEDRAFEDGEFKLRPLESVRDRDVYVIQSLAGDGALGAPARILRLAFLLSVLRDGAARRVTALVPYLAFARKDRRTQPRDPVSLRYLATLLEAAGLQQLVALDVHNPAALDNAFRIPVLHLGAAPLFATHFAAQAERPLAVVSPDIGGIKRAQLFVEALEQRAPGRIRLAFVEKRRAQGRVSGERLVGEVAGCDALIIDDLCATGTTLARAARALRDGGAARVEAVVTHALMPGTVMPAALAGVVDRLIVTDSTGWPMPPGVPDAPLQVLSIAPLFGAALRRMAAGEPVADLLREMPRA